MASPTTRKGSGKDSSESSTTPRVDDPLHVEFLLDERGAARIGQWLDTVPERVRLWMEAKVYRLAESRGLLLSGTKALGGGLRELRHLGSGPGYRVYLAIEGNRLIILGGGDKGRQKKDVEHARQQLRALRHSEGGHARADRSQDGQES